MLVASREDTSSSLKHLSPSAREWVSLVVRQTLTTKDKDKDSKKSRTGSAAPSTSQPQSSNTRTHPQPLKQSATASHPTQSSSDGNANSTPNQMDDEMENDDDDDEVNDLVRFVFEQNAQNPWDERLFKWVMSNFDKYASFLRDSFVLPQDPRKSSIPMLAIAYAALMMQSSDAEGEKDKDRDLRMELDAGVRSLVLQTPDWQPIGALMAVVQIESGGRVSIADEHADILKRALAAVNAMPAPQPKLTNAAIGLELVGLMAAIKKDQDRFHTRIKNICDPYLCLTVKSMNSLFDFDDFITERFLNLSIGKLLKNRLDKSDTIYSFEDYWSQSTSSMATPAKAKGKKGSASAPANSTATSANLDVKTLDGLWDAYLQQASSAANICHELIAEESINEIIHAAEQLRSVLVVSLDDMVAQCKTVTDASMEVVVGTKENLAEFKTFLKTESELFKKTSADARASLQTLIRDLNKLYHVDSASTTPTVRGRLERTRNREFIKRMKAFETEQANYRGKLISDLEEFAESIQWDCLVLGVEVVGACLDVCDEDLEIEHDPVREDWLAQISNSPTVKKRDKMLLAYVDGVKFGLFEYVKAVGKLLLEALGRAGGDTSLNLKSLASPSKTPGALSAASSDGAAAAAAKKKKNKKKKKKSGASKDAAALAESEVAAGAEPSETDVKESSKGDKELGGESEADDSDEDEMDAAIPPQYVQKRQSDTLVPEGSAATASGSVSPEKPLVVPVWPKPSLLSNPQKSADAEWPVRSPGTSTSAESAAGESQSAPSTLPGPTASAESLLLGPLPTMQLLHPPNLFPSLQSPIDGKSPSHSLQQQQQQPPQSIFQLQSGQMQPPDFNEVQHLRMACARATHDIAKLQNDCGMFLREIHRLNAEVVHWKTMAEGLQQQQQLRSPLESKAQTESVLFTPFSNLPQSQSQPQQQQSQKQNSLSNNQFQTLFMGNYTNGGANTSGGGVTSALNGESAVPKVRGKSPISWRKPVVDLTPGGNSSSGGTGGFSNTSSSNAGNRWANSAIGGERRGRPPGLMSSPRDLNGERRAFARGMKELRCGNCGEVGHESKACKAPCRYCDQLGHLAAQCPF
ncbi:hypothetical protein HDU80_001126 [Chytriomyces hyalinus]|nr:hypothetical protein HDU80_001126 [Chytriomyces hyalinus]